MIRFKNIAALKTLLQYKSFVFGLILLFFFVGLSIYASITWPYNEAIAKWNNPKAWEDYPKNARPAWITLFTGRRELESSVIIKEIVRSGDTFTYTLSYDYDEFPSSIEYFYRVDSSSRVYVHIEWIKPNGLNIVIDRGYRGIGEYSNIVDIKPIPPSYVNEYVKEVNRLYNVSLSAQELHPLRIFFMNELNYVKSTEYRVLKGNYTLRISISSADPNAIVRFKFIIKGTTYGLAGTDYRGRDLFMGIAWGAPIAIAFGLTASVVTSLLQLTIAAVSAWFRSIVDNVVQRTNEVFMVLPFLPTIIMLWMLYGLNLWILLPIIIVFYTWGGGLKTTRAMFLQVREMPYIEAALAYGASNWRIVFRYMVPRVLPVIIPGIVLAIPDFVFLEAALALLGIADPLAITWGKILQEAEDNAALFHGLYHWILAPSIMLFLLAIAFASIGFTLDRVFNPRLRQV